MMKGNGMLEQDMQDLILFTGAVYVDNKTFTQEDVCKIAAERFRLFSHAHEYPLWLSRIVEWTMKDVDDGTFMHGGSSGIWP